MPDDRREHERPLPARYPEYPEVDYPKSQRDDLDFTDADDTIHLLDYWHILVIRKWTVVAILVTVVGLAALRTFNEVPMYRATARIQIDGENPNIVSFQDIYQMETVANDGLQTQFRILSARSLARRVVEDLRLDEHDQFQAGPPSFSSGLIRSVTNVFATSEDNSGEGAVTDSDETDALRGVIGSYLGRLSVSPVGGTRLVDISFDSTDPEFATRVINAHSQHFIQQNLQFKVDATQEASTFLEGQLVSLKISLEQAEDRLQEYSVANDILFTGAGLNTAMEKLQQLQSQHISAQTNRFQKEAYNRRIQSGNADTLPQMNSEFAASLASQLAALQLEEAELAVTFAPEYPRRLRVRSQIDEIKEAAKIERQQIRASIESDFFTATEEETLLRDAVDTQLDAVNRINAELIQYNILKREVDSNKQVYDGLLNRLKEAEILAGLSASNIRIVDRAEVPSGAIRPQKTLDLAVGLVVGLTLGIGLAFFQEYIDNSIKSPDDVARYLGVPAIATIPKRTSLGDKSAYYGHYGKLADGANALESSDDRLEFISSESPTSVMAEAYRSLRTSLLLSSPDHPPRSILVTSAVPSEGKTVTAINLAISLTQTGARVVIVDADMRKPRVHSVFALGDTPGLSAVLTGNAGLKEALHESSVSDLFILPCGIVPPNPAELLLSARWQRLMAALSDYFDYVVIDSPPLANVSDARILAPRADATLLVVKAWSTLRHSAEQAVQGLLGSRARVAGVVLNDLDVRMKGYHSYYSGPSYYSGYGGPQKSA